MIIEKMNDGDLLAQWREKNELGHGWAPGEDSQTPEDAALADGYAIVRHLGEFGTPDYSTVLAAKDGAYIVVADANGPWAQDITD